MSTIDPADVVVDLETTGRARCPHDCGVVIEKTREHGAGEAEPTVTGYVKGKVIQALQEHIKTTHPKDPND